MPGNRARPIRCKWSVKSTACINYRHMPPIVIAYDGRLFDKSTQRSDPGEGAAGTAAILYVSSIRQVCTHLNHWLMILLFDRCHSSVMQCNVMQQIGRYQSVNQQEARNVPALHRSRRQRQISNSREVKGRRGGVAEVVRLKGQTRFYALPIYSHRTVASCHYDRHRER